jgi:hypothetical protein
MIGMEIDEALKALEDFEKCLEQIQPKSEREVFALERARSQAVRLAQQLRSLRDGFRQKESATASDKD